MKVDIIQTSLASGELAPSLLGRTDIAQYANAAETVENFLVRPYGSVRSTPGTQYISECKTGGSTGQVRLLEFTFSRTDAYVIEMGVGYFRFYTDGGIVTTGGTIYEVAHTFTEDELFDIQYSQLNDVIYLAHKDHAPQTLTRLAANSWTLADFNFLGGPFLEDNSNTATTITLSATAGTVNVTVVPTNLTTFVVSTGTSAGHTNSYWKIGSLMTNSTTGVQEQGYFKLDTVVNGYTATGSVISLLSTKGTTAWAEGAWSDYRGWPARVTFHQRRLCFARTENEPQKIWASKSFLYDDFGVESGFDDNALNIQVASTESNDIKWLASGKVLIAGTFGGDFFIDSGTGDPLTPSNTNSVKNTSVGSEDIQPIRIGNFFYYIQRFGQKLRELFYIWDNNDYKAADATILAPHIAGDGFIDMAYQQNPDNILWCVCSNGTLATLTREIDQEVLGWSRQTTDGNYESVATIPSQDGAFDEVWTVVKREIDGSDVRYIERFKNPNLPDRQDLSFFVHSGLTYNAYTAYTSTSISLSATAGTSVLVTSSSAYFAAEDVGERIRAIDSDGATVGELKITGYTSTTIVLGNIVDTFDASSYSAGSWGLSVDEISGLDHLEGETVTVLADGGTDKPNKVVSSGTITLSYNYFVVNAGLPYTQKIKLLPPEAGSQRGTSQAKKQRINEVGFKLYRSSKFFLVGGATDLLSKVQFRDPTTLMGTPESLYTGTIANIPFRDTYRYGSQVLISNSDPTHIELLSVITSIDTFDK